MRRRLRRDGRLLLRMLAVWVITAVVAILLAAVLPGFRVDEPAAALLAAAGVALINAVLWPLLTRLALGAVVATFGLLLFLADGILVRLVLDRLPGVQIEGKLAPFVVGLVLTVTTALASALMSLDDDHYYQRFIIGRAARRRLRDVEDPTPGVLFLQIDGLGYDVARRAMRDGNAPTMARWLRDGSHRLVPWETDWSSQTGASQAGILLGSNEDMPAFRWYDKQTGKLYVSSSVAGATAIEQLRSHGDGLLRDGGASRGNLFSGGAEVASLTLSVALRRKGKLGAGYYGYLANPYNAARTSFAFVAEVLREIVQSASQRRLDIRPRVGRGGLYPILRALSTVYLRDMTTQAVLEDMMAGRWSVYADFTGYDEVAHHSGIERYDSLAVLRGIDRQIGRLEEAARLAPRPYRLVVLSDHGQSQGEPFASRWGRSLEELVRGACDLPTDIGSRRSPGAGAESRGLAANRLEQAAAGDGPIAKALRRSGRQLTVDGAPVFGDAATERAAQQVSTGSELLVLASGNLGLVYLRDTPGRVTLEEIQRRYPNLLPTLVDHPGIGFVLVHSAEHGPVVLGADGAHRLATGVVTGTDPLAGFGPLAARRVLRTDGFPSVGDLMINSVWDQTSEQVTSFEQFVGSHGGMGGEQTRAFLLHPNSFASPDEPVFGAEQVHTLLAGWLAGLRRPAEVPATPETAEPLA